MLWSDGRAVGRAVLERARGAAAAAADAAGAARGHGGGGARRRQPGAGGRAVPRRAAAAAPRRRSAPPATHLFMRILGLRENRPSREYVVLIAPKHLTLPLNLSIVKSFSPRPFRRFFY